MLTDILKRYVVKGRRKKLAKFGDSRGVIIDKAILRALEWNEDTHIRMKVSKNSVIIEKDE